MQEERERGYFDEVGDYVEKRGEDDVEDAWMQSDEGKVKITAELRRHVVCVCVLDCSGIACRCVGVCGCGGLQCAELLLHPASKRAGSAAWYL